MRIPHTISMNIQGYATCTGWSNHASYRYNNNHILVLYIVYDHISTSMELSRPIKL